MIVLFKNYYLITVGYMGIFFIVESRYKTSYVRKKISRQFKENMNPWQRTMKECVGLVMLLHDLGRRVL